MSNLLIELNNRLCFKCLREYKKINSYIMQGREYGSIFDSTNATLQLCDYCNDDKLKVWFSEEAKLDDEGHEIYKHEDKIEFYIEKQLSVYGQELFYNRSDKSKITIDPIKWINELLD